MSDDWNVTLLQLQQQTIESLRNWQAGFVTASGTFVEAAQAILSVIRPTIKALSALISLQRPARCRGTRRLYRLHRRLRPGRRA